MKRVLKFTTWVLLCSALFFISCRREVPVTPTPNPVSPSSPGVMANAGIDRTIVLPNSPATLPNDFIWLDARNSYDSSGGSLASYFWRQTSGPNQCVIKYDTAQVTSIDNLIEGKYSIELTVRGKMGGTSRDNVHLNVIRDTLSGKEIIFSGLTWVLDTLDTDYFLGVWIDSQDFYTIYRSMKISLKLDTSSVWIDVPIFYPYVPQPQYDHFVCNFFEGPWGSSTLWVYNTHPFNYQLTGTKVSVRVQFL